MIRRVLILVAGLAGAVTTSQAPEFMQQYKQRLGGAAQELMRMVEDFDADAASEGLTRDAALARYEVSPDTFFQKRGDSMTRTMVRFERITGHQQDLINASAFERPVLFLKYRDDELLDGTIADYRPAVPTTAEGAVYAFTGFLIGWGAMALFLAGFSRLRRLFGRGSAVPPGAGA